MDSNQCNAVGNSSDWWECIEKQGGTGVVSFALWGDKGFSSSAAADLLHWTCTSEEKDSAWDSTSVNEVVGLGFTEHCLILNLTKIHMNY